MAPLEQSFLQRPLPLEYIITHLTTRFSPMGLVMGLIHGIIFYLFFQVLMAL